MATIRQYNFIYSFLTLSNFMLGKERCSHDQTQTILETASKTPKTLNQICELTNLNSQRVRELFHKLILFKLLEITETTVRHDISDKFPASLKHPQKHPRKVMTSAQFLMTLQQKVMTTKKGRNFLLQYQTLESFLDPYE